MASINAKQVAKEVLKKVRKGGKVKLGKIIRKAGYSKSVSKSPTKVTRTKTYKKEMKPIVDQLITERRRAIQALKGKIGKAKYRDLVDGVDKLTKNIQLLSGGDTEKNNLTIKWED